MTNCELLMLFRFVLFYLLTAAIADLSEPIDVYSSWIDQCEASKADQ